MTQSRRDTLSALRLAPGRPVLHSGHGQTEAARWLRPARQVDRGHYQIANPA